jgi:hypothetical protein
MSGALAFIEPQMRVCPLPSTTHRSSWITYRNLSAEGAWQLTDIAGAGPKDLAGTLCPLSAGQAELRRLEQGASRHARPWREGRGPSVANLRHR